MSSKDLLNQDVEAANNLEEIRAVYTEVWKKDIRFVAESITEHMEDPEMLLKVLATYIQEARHDGFPKIGFH